MNKDFHYYGTYLAAKVAGFSNDDAAVIAYAGQYVDDSDADKIMSKDRYYIKDFTPIPTVQTNVEVFKNFSINMLTEKLQNTTARVWSCFHFLPGNYEDGIKKTYTGEKYSKAIEDSWTFDKKSEQQFKLMCLPNSEIVREMINDITNYHKSQKYYLQLLGLRMHSLADTWAHMYHCGISAWFINDSYDVKELGPDLKPNKSPIIWISDPFFDDNISLHKYSCSTRSKFFNSFSYLGHARMGHFPDYGFKRYSYRPNWSNTPITKDNPSHFLSAFKQMVEAMKAIKENRYFNNETALLPSNVEEAVNKVIATVATDQSDAWKKAISTLGYSPLPEYDEKLWLNNYINSKPNGNYYYNFNFAALLHMNLVKDILRRNNIYLDEIPEKNNHKAKIKNLGSNKYFGKAVKSVAYNYPSLNTDGVEISFITADKELKSGDTVEIRTNESYVSNDYPYLMAWKTPALYYQAKEFGMNRSKWTVQIKNEPDGTPITTGKQLYIKNVHYKDKPFMQPYYSLIPPMGNYFTTAASSGNNKQLWSIELTNSEKYFYIFCKNNNNVLQIRDSSKNDMAKIEQGNLTSSDSQKFRLIPCNDNYFYIQSLYSQKMLDIDQVSQEQNAPLIQYHKNDGDNQKFQFLDCGDGYCYIVPKHSGKPLKRFHDDEITNTSIVQFYDSNYDNQKFIFEELSTGKFKIKVVHSGKYLTVKDNSTLDLAQIVQFSDLGTSSSSQIFEMIKLNEPNLYSLKNSGSGLYIDVDRISYEDNTNVIQYHSNNGNNQKFYIIDCDGGYKRIISKHAKKSLAIYNSSKEDGANLVQFHQETPECQKFRLVYVG